MPSITTTWYDVDEFLPGNEDYRPVRAINSDMCHSFYFTAAYLKKDGSWEFFDEKYNKKGHNGMQVTHWTNEINLEEEHIWIDGKPLDTD